MGGLGPKRTPELAARFATEYNAPFVNPADAAKQFGLVREACERKGRDPHDLTYSVATTICCGTDDAEVARRAEKIGRSVENLETYATAGTPAQVVDRLHDFGNSGAEVVYLQVIDMDDLDHIRLLGEDVLPHIF